LRFAHEPGFPHRGSILCGDGVEILVRHGLKSDLFGDSLGLLVGPFKEKARTDAFLDFIKCAKPVILPRNHLDDVKPELSRDEVADGAGTQRKRHLFKFRHHLAAAKCSQSSPSGSR